MGGILRLAKGSGRRRKNELVTTIFAHYIEQGNSVYDIVSKINSWISHGKLYGCLCGKVKDGIDSMFVENVLQQFLVTKIASGGVVAVRYYLRAVP